MSEQRRLLAIASRPSDFVEMADLARVLAGRGHELTVLYFCWRFDPALPQIRSDVDSLVRATPTLTVKLLDIESGIPIEAATPSSAAADDDESIGLLRKRLRVIRKSIRYAHQLPGHLAVLPRVRPAHYRQLPRVLFQAWATTAAYSRFLRLFVREIRAAGAGAVLIPEDIVGNLWPVSIRAAHQCGIPALVFPYTLANRQEAIQSLRSLEVFQASENAVAAALFPKWRYQDDGVDLVRLPSGQIFAHQYLGIDPPDPWMMNSGFADKILVDSRASADYFQAGGIPPGQMAVVGSVSQDRMFQQRQHRDASLQALRDELGLSGRKPLLLISGCPNQLSAPVPGCEFTTMEAMARFVGESVAPLAAHYHLVVRPHPNFTEFGAMLEPFGIKSTTAPTASLVPLADLFIAFASATIRWAIACGIPTVNFDVFHYGYGDFTAARGVTPVDGGAEFRDLVRSLTPDSAAQRALAAHAGEDSAHWSQMDGRGVERIEHEIQQARQRRTKMSKEQQRNA